MSNKVSIDLGTIFSQLPDMFIQQFARLACYYLGYTNSETQELDRTEYVNETCNAINILTKLVVVSSNGDNIDRKVSLDPSSIISLQKAVQYYKNNCQENDKAITDEEPNPKSKNKKTEEILDPVDVIKNELELIGIDSNTYAYKAICDIPHVCRKGMTAKEAYSLIGKNNGKNAGVTANAINRAVFSANFENSSLFFKTLEPSTIDKDFFISNLIELFCN